MSMEDDVEGGIAEIESGLEALVETGSGMRRSYYLALLVEALGRAGRTDSAIETVETALQAAEQTGERRWTAETHRLRGILLLARNPKETSIAETSLVQAISLARSQGARLIELRASLDLAVVARTPRCCGPTFGACTNRSTRASRRLISSLSGRLSQRSMRHVATPDTQAGIAAIPDTLTCPEMRSVARPIRSRTP